MLCTEFWNVFQYFCYFILFSQFFNIPLNFLCCITFDLYLYYIENLIFAFIDIGSKWLLEFILFCRLIKKFNFGWNILNIDVTPNLTSLRINFQSPLNKKYSILFNDQRIKKLLTLTIITYHHIIFIR